ncbi:hypothetical protein HK105_200343 [Polyrhizophydium stewartii]|uniref:Defective in cullin neddylation protein n=1 Tax=Polyrhizophydium stewartii TaxID=2732419 RepID=A0ABR4NL69_9FUNG
MPPRKRRQDSDGLEKPKPPAKTARKKSDKQPSKKAAQVAPGEALVMLGDGAEQRLQWFDKYQDKSEEHPTPTIGPEGLEQMCSDVGIPIDGLEILIVAWQMEAKRMGFFTLEEWQHGMGKLGAFSKSSLKASLLPFQKIHESAQQANLRDLYKFAFDFAKESHQRTLPVEMGKVALQVPIRIAQPLMDANDTAHAPAIGLWKLILPAERFPLMGMFLDYLESKEPVKVITRDQWMQFLDFIRAVKPNLDGYEEDGAWPGLLDDFVAWKRADAEQ